MARTFFGTEPPKTRVMVACWAVGAIVANLVVWSWIGRPASHAYGTFLFQSGGWLLVFGMFAPTFGLMAYLLWWTFPRPKH